VRVHERVDEHVLVDVKVHVDALAHVHQTALPTLVSRLRLH
jgi:hypothetical protein